VETPEHLRFLAQRNCDEAQGYYFSRPVAAAGFVEAVHAIHRMFDERKLLEEMRLPPPESASLTPGVGAFSTDQDLEQQASPFRQYQGGKQVVM
jgi:predicted signal transduction protein with EAL and GGDEF domain